MRVPLQRSQDGPVLPSLSLPFLLFPSLIAAATTIDCTHVRVNDESFDLRSLGGPHSVMHSVEQPPRWHNTTYTIDICQPLKRSKEVAKQDECPNGARVCAIERLIIPEENLDTIEKVTTIAGNLLDQGGGPLDAGWTLLRNSASNSDIDKEGIRLELNGGYYPLTGKNRRKQKAIVEFLCDPNRTGLEGNYEGEDRYQPGGPEDEKRRTRRAEGEEGGEDGGDDNQENPASLRFIRYGDEGSDTDVLRLEWLTMAACEGKRDADLANNSWGFFTWFIIILFMATASYLIFGSWLNYNRYGARGWDMLPHGDTIRDLPYLMKDWTRRVVNTVQNGGSRGGYSAV